MGMQGPNHKKPPPTLSAQREEDGRLKEDISCACDMRARRYVGRRHIMEL